MIRRITALGLILVLASFVPAIAEVFNSLPQAVLGGCTIMMFGNIILSGFQMIAEAAGRESPAGKSAQRGAGHD